MTDKKKKEQQEPEPTFSERFLHKVQKEFSAAVGHGVEFTSYEKQLASNMYLMIDASLKEFEAKRVKNNQTKRTPFLWKNINMPKLATDGVHRVRLGLDSLIPNHLHAIPYWNSKTEKYDIDLRVGYRGKDYYRRKFALKPVKNIRYELKYSTDEFQAIKKDRDNEVETYLFQIKNPWDRGEVEGGFGYVEYEDPTENFLVMVPESEFKKVEKEAKASTFWQDWGDRMRYKTLVHRVTDKLDADPEKIHVSYHYVEQQDSDVFTTPAEKRQPIDIPGLPAHDEREYVDPDKDFSNKKEFEAYKNKMAEKKGGAPPHPADAKEVPNAFDYKTKNPNDEDKT